VDVTRLVMNCLGNICSKVSVTSIPSNSNKASSNVGNNLKVCFCFLCFARFVDW
jgi:hypothetical protein